MEYILFSGNNCTNADKSQLQNQFRSQFQNQFYSQFQSQLPQQRLLLVGDNSSSLLANGFALQETLPRYDIITALGPQRGLEAVAQDPHGFTGVVSDYLMPEMNGIDFLASSVIHSWGEHHYQEVFRLLVSSSSEYLSPRSAQIVWLPETAQQMGIYFMVHPTEDDHAAFAAGVQEMLQEHLQKPEYVDGYLIPRRTSDIRV